MTELLDFLKGFNLQTILAMGGLLWFFTRDLKAELHEMNEQIHKMNTRIGRVEGTVYGKNIYKQIKEE